MTDRALYFNAFKFSPFVNLTCEFCIVVRNHDGNLLFFLRFFCKSGNFVLMSSPETVDYIMRRTNFRQKSLFWTSSCVSYDYIVMKINFKQNSRPMIATMMSFFWNLPVQIAMMV